MVKSQKPAYSKYPHKPRTQNRQPRSERVVLGFAVPALGFHRENTAFAVVVAFAADNRSVRLRPSVLPAAGAGVFRLAGHFLGPRRFVLRPGLPVKLEAGSFEFGERLGECAAVNDVMG